MRGGLPSLVFLVTASLLPSATPQKLVVILCEGLGGDKFGKYENLDGFRLFQRDGVVSTKLYPVFPTMPLPNRHTLFTGLVPRKHGLISEYIYNWKTGETFEDFSAPSDLVHEKWWTSEPLYVSASKQKARVALLNMPECKVNWPDAFVVCFSTTTNATYSDDAEKIIYLTKAHDIVIYRDESVYRETSEHGPSSVDVHAKDTFDKLSKLLVRLHKEASDRIDLNLIFVSLHGAIDLPSENVRTLDDFLSMDMINRTVGSGAFMQIVAKPGKTHQIYSQLRYHSPIPNVTIYFTTPKAGDLPDRYNFKLSPIVSDLVLLADPGFGIATQDAVKRWPRKTRIAMPAGMAGYDAQTPAMNGLFMAFGPIFRRGYSKGALEVPDIYVLLCTVLRIHECNHTPGSIRRIGDVLDSQFMLSSSAYVLSFHLILLVLSMSLAS